MQHPKRTLLFALAVLIAGASAANAQTMRYRFKEKEKLTYAIEQKTKSTVELAGAKVDTDINASMTLRWEVLKVDREGNAQVKIKMLRSKLVMDNVLGKSEVDSESKDGPTDAIGKMLVPMNKAIAAMEVTATMLPTGELKDVKVSEATVKAMKAIPGAEQFGDLTSPDNFKDMISSVTFPTGSVAKGKSWSTKSESMSPEGKLTTETQYVHEGTIDRDGAKLEKISLKPTIKVVPNPKAIMKVKSIEAAGHVLFDNKTGQLVESTVSQTKVGKVSAMGLTLDSTSVQTTTIRLKKQTAAEKTAAANKIASLKINEDEYVEKTAAKETLETIAGVSRSFNLERKYEPSITMTGSALASDELKAKVESALDVTLGKKITVKESVTLDGKAVTKLNVVWVERFRRATATTNDGRKVEFLVKVGLRLKLEKAK